MYFKAPVSDGEPWKRVLRRANSEPEARKIFDAAELAIDTEQATPAPAPERANRTIAALAVEYIKDSEARGRPMRTIQGRESRINTHIAPGIGGVLVSKWRLEDSRRVMEKGSKTIHSARGREDLRGQLAAMCKLAWRLGWLDRSVDPLDGLEIGRTTVLQGATTHYVDPRLRPETRPVLAMARAADLLCGDEGTNPQLTRLPLFGTKIRVAGFGGLWLGEQNGLRAIDLWLFVDTAKGLPVWPEMHNDRWHNVREWVDMNDPENAWPRTNVYRNLRHHAATKWFHEELGGGVVGGRRAVPRGHAHDGPQPLRARRRGRPTRLGAQARLRVAGRAQASSSSTRMGIGS